MPRCRPKDNTDKFGENPNITLIQIEYLILGMPAAAAKSLQSCQTLCDPIDGSPPGSPDPGFSRQEHWSGLPFPSPQVCLNLVILKDILEILITFAFIWQKFDVQQTHYLSKNPRPVSKRIRIRIRIRIRLNQISGIRISKNGATSLTKIAP